MTTVGKTWCFTINNYGDDDFEKLSAYFDKSGEEKLVSRVTIGRECGDSGTPHLQGCVTFCKARRFNSFKKLLFSITNKWAHIEKAKMANKAHDYCEKEDHNCYKYDNRKQGKRSDLHDASDLLLESGNLRTVAMEHPVTFIRYHKGLMAMRSIMMEPFVGKPHVIWAYGPTGLGKSLDARTRFPGARRITTIAAGRFFTGYGGEQQVILDDLRPSDVKFSFLLNLLDYGAMHVELKGADIP